MDPVIVNINAVVYQERGMWIAHCLEYSFVSCARTLEDLPNELLDQVLDQIEADLKAGHRPFYGFKRAPQKYWDMFEAARESSRPLKPRKGLKHRWSELAERCKVDAALFPIAQATA